MDCSSPAFSVHGDSPGTNTRVGYHALLCVIFPTQGSNPGLSHCRWILYRPSHQGSPVYTWHTRKQLLLYLKWITNKNPLYSIGNSAQCYVAAWVGGGFGGERIHVYARLSPFTVHLKLSRHCQLAISQYKIKSSKEKKKIRWEQEYMRSDLTSTLLFQLLGLIIQSSIWKLSTYETCIVLCNVH